MALSSNKPVWIVSHESQKQLAESVAAECKAYHNARIFAQTSVPRVLEYKNILQWKNFSDGFPNLFIEKVDEMAGKDVIFVASFHSVQVIFEQISMIYAIPRYLAHSFTVILPYFPTGTMERIDLEGQVATAKTLATILSDIPQTACGPTPIMIFDIHALQERFYFTNHVIPRLETAIPLVVKAIQNAYSSENVAIAFPDEGAQKRFARLLPNKWHQIVCSKTRDGDKRQIRIKEGNADGKNVIIIDDLVQSGGTLLEAGKVLKASNALTVSAYVTHAVFPKESWRQFISDPSTGKKSVFDNFWVTDSIPHATSICQHEPFKILSLAGMIAHCLLGFELKT